MDIEKQTANEIAEEADNAQGREISDDVLEGVVGGIQAGQFDQFVRSEFPKKKPKLQLGTVGNRYPDVI